VDKLRSRLICNFSNFILLKYDDFQKAKVTVSSRGTVMMKTETRYVMICGGRSRDTQGM
jgi:hypothetical protein